MAYRFAIIQDQLCLSVEAIAAALGMPLESALNVVWKGLKRNREGSPSWAHHMDDADARRRWVIYDTLPESTRYRVDTYYAESLLDLHWRERLYRAAVDMIEEYDRTYMYSIRPGKDGRALSSTQVEQLVEACGWLRLCASTWWKEKFPRRSAFLTHAANEIAGRDIYGLRIKNDRVLLRRVDAWVKDGYNSIIPRKYGNDNASKLTDTQVKRIISIYASPIKPSVVQTTDVYNQEAKERGWPQLSYERIRQFLREPATMQTCNLARHGRDAARNLQERNIRRRRPSHADALWVLDGSTIQLYYTDEKGQIRSDLYGVVVADAYSGAIIGRAIGYTETSTLVQAALRHSVRTTGMQPHQLQYDNSSANKAIESAQVMQKLAKLHFPTAPYSGKAKVIEAIWGRIEQGFMRAFPSFKGGNITAKSVNTRANPDYIAQLRREGHIPSREAIIAQFHLAVELYNNTVSATGQTPVEKYRTADPRRKEFDTLAYIDCFWVDRRHSVRYTKDGIIMEVDQKRYHYEVESERGIEDMRFRRQWLGESFQVKYDPDDLSSIALYRDGAYIATAVEKYAAPMAITDYEEGDGTIIRKALDQRKAYWAQLQQEIQDVENYVQQEGFSPVDFRLLHKDALNRMEGAMVDDLLASAAVVSVKPAAVKPVRLYDDSDADGSIVNTNI